MKIVYIAKHNSGGNDEEGSISYALEKLGHEVFKIHESKVPIYRGKVHGDLLLMHKYQDVTRLPQFSMPKVCWFWDMVVFPNDGEMVERNQFRLKWLRNVIDSVDLVFMTDGDWLQSNKNCGKLHILRQGHDERRIGIGRREDNLRNDVLMTATRYGWGTGRREFVNWMYETYRGRMTHVVEGKYGQELADLMVNHGVVVAPEYPMTDLYWSNRVYLTLGYGGFLLHPVSAGLMESFQEMRHLTYYHDKHDLECRLEMYMKHPEARRHVAQQGMEEIRQRHTYTHRCVELLSVVKRELGVG
jgi:hypothetical protein